MLCAMIFYGVTFIVVFLLTVSIKSEEKGQIWKERMCAGVMCHDMGINA